MDDWRMRLESSQKYSPEDVLMTPIAHKDIGKALQRIERLEAALEIAMREAKYVYFQMPINLMPLIIEHIIEPLTCALEGEDV